MAEKETNRRNSFHLTSMATPSYPNSGHLLKHYLRLMPKQLNRVVQLSQTSCRQYSFAVSAGALTRAVVLFTNQRIVQSDWPIERVHCSNAESRATTSTSRSNGRTKSISSFIPWAETPSSC